MFLLVVELTLIEGLVGELFNCGLVYFLQRFFKYGMGGCVIFMI